MADIMLPAREIFSIGPIPITDGFLGSLLATITLLGIAVAVAHRFSIVPTRMQVALEMITDYLMGQLENAFGSKKRAEEFFPFFMTMLLFLVVANQFMFVPFIFEITYGGADVFRQSTSDFAQPIAFALIVATISNVMAIRISPLRYLGNFFDIMPFFKARSLMDFFNAAVGFFIGLLNIIGEFAKVVSLAARLFGNIFAGNVMVAVIIGLSAYTQFLVPLPFIILSTFSGFVQAFVFMLLSIQFIAMSISSVQEAPAAEVPASA